jgi:long-chain fatty acid transport protein
MRRLRVLCRISPLLATAVALLWAGEARASNVTEFPDNGSEQEARGGAWMARATDPLAAFFNPAGLAGQETRLTLQANVNFRHTCFTRVAAASDGTADRLADPNTGAFPRVCNDIAPFPDPQLGFTWRATDRIGIGFLPLIAPSSVGNLSYPEFQNGTTPNLPAPERYLLTNANGILLTPTLGAGFEVIDGLRLGASFQWGIASLHFENASQAVNARNNNPVNTDVKASVDVKDLFFPGFTLGALYSPIDDFDVAAWYKWSAPIDAKGDLKTSVNYYTPAVANGNTRNVVTGDTSQANCGITGGQNLCGSGNNVEMKIPVPMEAKLGLRYHKSRVAGTRTSHLRDPLSQDVFDVEADFTWANNSTFQDLSIRLPDNGMGMGLVPVNGIPGAVVPPVADVPHNYKDVFGIRIGGDYVLLPDQLALRAGGFFETNGQDAQFQNIDFAGSQRFGFAFGGTYRLHLSRDAGKKSALEFSLGYGHVFYADETNTDRNASGVNGLSGAPCTNPDQQMGNMCQPQNGGKAYPIYHTAWPVNLGTITNTMNVINVGVSYRF